MICLDSCSGTKKTVIPQKIVFVSRNLKDYYQIYHSQQKLKKEITVFLARQFLGFLEFNISGNQSGGKKKAFFFKTGKGTGRSEEQDYVEKPPEQADLLPQNRFFW
jgi:hypothetical protein